jgi:hypothetical protein
MLRILVVNLTAQPQIISRVMARERYEVFVEVGLVVVLRLMCDQRPVYGLCGAEVIKDVLKAI